MDVEVSTEVDRVDWLKYIISLGVGGVMVTAFLYVCGKEYTAGYLRYWHLKDGLFSIPFHEVLFQSYYALITLGIPEGAVQLLAGIGVFAVFLAVGKLLRLLSRWEWLASSLRWLNKSLGLARGDDIPVRNPMHFPLWVTSLVLLISYVLFGVAIFSAVFGSAINQIGYEVAKKQHEVMDQKASRSTLSSIFQFGPANTSSPYVSGELVTCFNQRCVVLNSSQVFVIGAAGHIIAQSVID